MNETQDNWNDDSYLLSRFDDECGSFKGYDDRFMIDDEFDCVDQRDILRYVA